MTLYYHGPTARVTQEVLEVRCPSYESFAISELRSVHEVRNGHQSARPIKVGSVALVGATTVLGTVMWPVFGLLLTILATLAVLVISMSVAAVVLWQSRRPSMELWGTYRGQPTRLYHTTDRLTFGQVSRALRRVFELIDDMH